MKVTAGNPLDSGEVMAEPGRGGVEGGAGEVTAFWEVVIWFWWNAGDEFRKGGGAYRYGDLDTSRHGRYKSGLSAVLSGRGDACGCPWCLRSNPTAMVTDRLLLQPRWASPTMLAASATSPGAPRRTGGVPLRRQGQRQHPVTVQFWRICKMK
ncbi:unnamed protein product [Urochloa humidicola]